MWILIIYWYSNKREKLLETVHFIYSFLTKKMAKITLKKTEHKQMNTDQRNRNS